MDPLHRVCAHVFKQHKPVVPLRCRKWMAEEVGDEVGAGMQDTPELTAHGLGSGQSHFVQHHPWPRI